MQQRSVSARQTDISQAAIESSGSSTARISFRCVTVAATSVRRTARRSMRCRMNVSRMTLCEEAPSLTRRFRYTRNTIRRKTLDEQGQSTQIPAAFLDLCFRATSFNALEARTHMFSDSFFGFRMPLIWTLTTCFRVLQSMMQVHAGAESTSSFEEVSHLTWPRSVTTQHFVGGLLPIRRCRNNNHWRGQPRPRSY